MIKYIIKNYKLFVSLICWIILIVILGYYPAFYNIACIIGSLGLWFGFYWLEDKIVE